MTECGNLAEKLARHSVEHDEREAAFRALEADIEAANGASVNFRYRLEKVQLLVSKAAWAIPCATLPLLWRLGVLVNRNAEARRQRLVELGFAGKVLRFEQFLFERVGSLDRRLALLDLIRIRRICFNQLLLDFKDGRIEFDAVIDAFQAFNKAKEIIQGSTGRGANADDFNGCHSTDNSTTKEVAK